MYLSSKGMCAIHVGVKLSLPEHVFNKVLRKIVWPERENITERRKLHTEELHNWYSSHNPIRVIKSRVQSVGHVAHMGGYNKCLQVLVEEPHGPFYSIKVQLVSLVWWYWIIFLFVRNLTFSFQYLGLTSMSPHGPRPHSRIRPVASSNHMLFRKVGHYCSWGLLTDLCFWFWVVTPCYGQLVWKYFEKLASSIFRSDWQWIHSSYWGRRDRLLYWWLPVLMATGKMEN